VLKFPKISAVWLSLLFSALALCFSANYWFYRRYLRVVPRSKEEQQMIDIYKRVNKAVVFITSITLETDPFNFFLNYEPRRGTGSGIIFDADNGLVLTNLHVIGDAYRVDVSLGDGHSVSARLLGSDEFTDFAVLKMQTPPKKLSSIKFGDSQGLEIGQRVLAIGNPFGLNRTLTSGIISSLDRVVGGQNGILLKGLIQTDASINPGNSGGPLLDMNGDLIGINVAILSKSGGSVGIGFSAPINQLKSILPQILTRGKVERSKLGWTLTDNELGPIVLKVAKNSAAEKGGLRPLESNSATSGVSSLNQDYSKIDVVYKVNGIRVKNREQVEFLISQNSPPTQPIHLTIRQGGKAENEREVLLKPDLS
jgi:S1-C subfamily serine protease